MSTAEAKESPFQTVKVLEGGMDQRGSIEARAESTCGPARIGSGLEMAAQAASGPRQPEPAPLGEAAFHGLAGRIVHRIEPHSEADPAAILVQLLIAFGNLVGRLAENDRLQVGSPGSRQNAPHQCDHRHRLLG